MSGARLVWHEFRYDQKIFWRNPAAVFFTVMLPVIFMVMFNLLFGNDTIASRHHLKVSIYYVPGIITVAVVSATLVSLAISVTRSREDGVLKRLRGTPAPAWVVVAGRVGNAIVVSALMVVVVTLLGRIAYGVPLPGSTIPALAVTLVLGAAAFCCLGFALTGLIPSEEAAPPVTQAIVLPLFFLSGPFVPESDIPNGVLNVAGILPIRPFFESLLAVFDPTTTGAGFEPKHLAVVVAWGVAAAVISLLTFRWTPRGEAG